MHGAYKFTSNHQFLERLRFAASGNIPPTRHY